MFSEERSITRFAVEIWEYSHAAPGWLAFRQRLLERLALYLACDSGVVVSPGPQVGASHDPRPSVALGIENGIFEHYIHNRVRYYSTEMPLAAAVIARGVVDVREVYRDDLNKLAQYREVIEPAGITSALCGALRFGGWVSGIVMVSRTRRAHAFGQADIERSRGLLTVASMADFAFAARYSPPLSDDMTAFTLTPRERQVLVLLRMGLQNKQIAASLGTSVDTVRKQTMRIYEKFQVSGRVELLARLTPVSGPASFVAPATSGQSRPAAYPLRSTAK